MPHNSKKKGELTQKLLSLNYWYPINNCITFNIREIYLLIKNRGDPDPLQVQILSFLYHFIGHCEAKEKKAWLHIVPILPPPPHHGPGKQWGKENPEQSASITPPPPLL